MGYVLFGLIAVGLVRAMWQNVRRPPPGATRVRMTGPSEALQCGFSVRTATSISTNTTPPFGRVRVGAKEMWFTGPRGRRGWAIEREDVTIERRRHQWIVDGYRLFDGSFTVDVIPDDDEKWQSTLRNFGWPLPPEHP